MVPEDSTLLQSASRRLRYTAVGICVLAIVLGAGQPMASRWKQKQKPATPQLPLCSRVSKQQHRQGGRARYRFLNTPSLPA